MSPSFLPSGHETHTHTPARRRRGRKGTNSAESFADMLFIHEFIEKPKTYTRKENNTLKFIYILRCHIGHNLKSITHTLDQDYVLVVQIIWMKRIYTRRDKTIICNGFERRFQGRFEFQPKLIKLN